MSKEGYKRQRDAIEVPSDGKTLSVQEAFGAVFRYGRSYGSRSIPLRVLWSSDWRDWWVLECLQTWRST